MGVMCLKTGIFRKLLQRAKQIKRKRLLQRERNCSVCSHAVMALAGVFTFTLKGSVGKEGELQEESLD